jgi:alkylation response protein AidB-like acyl-CoA dehydrogenase
MGDRRPEELALVDELIADSAGEWDRQGVLPLEVLRKLGADGLLCAQVGVEYGGLGRTSLDNGELTAHTGSRCGSVRSVMTSQGMAAWTIQRLGDREQQAEYLPRLVAGELAAVAFSEPHAGSDLSAISTSIRREGDNVVVDGDKVWVTAARYADLMVVFGRFEDGAAAVVVPARTPGRTATVIPDPMGCRAAGHADLSLDSVRLPFRNVLGGVGQSLPLVVTSALAYGRMSVAWGCVGILRGCLAAARAHAGARHQFGKRLAEHQLVARQLAELLVSEQVSTRVCEHASRCWDARSPESVAATVLAKHVSAGHAASGAATAVQLLASAGVRDGQLTARAYRDAKLMEIIEGSTELCQLMLARHAMEVG